MCMCVLRIELNSVANKEQDYDCLQTLSIIFIAIMKKRTFIPLKNPNNFQIEVHSVESYRSF